jgi:5-methyltetrahydrofolate--homocysteine methyltransferase
LEGDATGVSATVRQALDAGVEPAVILNDGMIASMREVGRLFEVGRYYLPEMMVSAQAMEAGLGILEPHLQPTATRAAGTIVIGTVQGDIHDIGKNLVATMLRGAGFEVRDLGVDVSPPRFVESISAGDVDVLGFSALLTTTMPGMDATIEALRRTGLRESVKIMVGGAPVTQAYAEQIGADGFAPDASQAVRLAQSLVRAQEGTSAP